VKLLIDYANQKNITLILNNKDKNGEDPFLSACKNNNSEIVKLLINYTDEKNITLKINDKSNKNGFSTFMGMF